VNGTAVPDPDIVRLAGVMAAGPGHPDVVVGLVDGPVDQTHDDLADARITTLPGSTAICQVRQSEACRHGTAIAGILVGRGGVCPGCTLLVRPVFCEAPPGGTCPALTPDELAMAIVDVVDAGVRIVNLSLGVTGHALARSQAVDGAFDHALARGALVVVSAGNHGHVGPAPLMTHPWPVRVTACDATGRPLPDANLGITIGRTGLRAPGSGILTTAPGGGYQRLTGTSAAAAFVTGTAALLWSAVPRLTAPQLRAALIRPDVHRRSIVPPLLDAAASMRALTPFTFDGPMRSAEQQFGLETWRHEASRPDR
jgi:subtilisin family serine protease